MENQEVVADDVVDALYSEELDDQPVFQFTESTQSILDILSR